MRHGPLVSTFLVALSVSSTAWADDETPEPFPAPAEPAPAARVAQPIAVAGSVVPGVVVHGAGSWLSGDDDTAKRLLLLEAAGITLTAGSLGALALTGAARHWVGILASTAILGAGAFSISFLGDVYRTAAPKGFGKHPGALPWGTSSVGILWVTNPQFNLGPVVESGGELLTGRWIGSVLLGHAPEALHSRLRMENGYRLWGAEAQRTGSKWGGSHSTLSMAYEDIRFGKEGFSSSGPEIRWWGRADSEQLAPNIRGAFVDWELGYAGKVTTYHPSDATSRETLLLAGFAFGAYHGDPTTVGGETRLYYSHRHDGYTGGMLQAGLGSGVIGKFGLESQHFVSPTWGVRMVSEVGSAWTLGLYLVLRAWPDASGEGPMDF